MTLSSAQGIREGLLIERYTMEQPRFTDHLDAIKLICKDFWYELFKKQIDNLKTNHRVPLSCKVVSFSGFHGCLLIRLLKMEMYLKKIMRPRLRTWRYRYLTCIFISLGALRNLGVLVLFLQILPTSQHVHLWFV